MVTMCIAARFRARQIGKNVTWGQCSAAEKKIDNFDFQFYGFIVKVFAYSLFVPNIVHFIKVLHGEINS